MYRSVSGVAALGRWATLLHDTMDGVGSVILGPGWSGGRMVVTRGVMVELVQCMDHAKLGVDLEERP